MALNLMALLQSAGTGIVPEEGEDILVNGQQSGMPVAEEPAAIALGNRGMLEEVGDASKNAPKRSGMFGTKGTFRDILGVLGDAFLMQSGNRAMYRPIRDKEKMADAMVGFTQNPQAAIERMANENPEMAAKMYEDWQNNQVKQAQMQSLQDTRNSQISEREYKKRQDFGNYAARVFAKANTPEKQAAAQRLIEARAKTEGINLQELGINPTMSDDERSVLSAGDMTVNQQEALPRRDRQLDISEGQLGVAQQNADSNRIRANRPPAGRAAPQPTDAALAAPLIQKMGKVGWKGLSSNEQEQLRSLGRSPDRGSRGKTKRQPPALPPGFKIK